MHLNKNIGIPVHGEVSSADASLGVAFVFYDATGATVSLGSNHQLVIESYQVVVVASGRAVIAVNTDVAGKRLRHGSFAANSGMGGSGVELVCPKGVIPKLFAPAGQADANIEGRLIKLG